MPPWYTDDAVTVWHGDCLTVLADMADNSVDAVCTDPPYGLEFMGKDWDRFTATGSSSLLHSPKDEGRTFSNASGHMWDNTKALPRFPGAGLPYQQWCQTWAEHCLRVLKPGGHLLAFGGTRTHHRLTCAIEDAGFEIRDSIAWLYGSGFPKSLDVGKAIDRAAGAEREMRLDERWASRYPNGPGGGGSPMLNQARPDILSNPLLTSDPVTDDARRWNGWGTALKPAHEPIVVARKPLAGSVAANVLAWGTGGLNIDAARVGTSGATKAVDFATKEDGRLERWDEGYRGARNKIEQLDSGRWPPNVALDQATADQLDRESGTSVSRASAGRNGQPENAGIYIAPRQRDEIRGHDDYGGASRFFPVFRHQQMCALYGMLSGCGRTPSASSTTPANTANGPSATSPATIAAIALEDAPTRSVAQNALAASSAGMLCASCVTAIAQSVAAISRGHSATQVLGLPSTADSSERILTRSLALIAEDLAKPATTLTTTDLMTSLGCAVDAISTYTTRAFRHEQRRFGPSSDLPLWRYEPKAPTHERPRVPGGDGGRVTNLGGKIRECNVCGTQVIHSGDNDLICGHGDYRWIEPVTDRGAIAAHPTVKPLDLMRWLVRLVCPPGGVVLDPFLGSGTTAEACIVEGFRCIGVEREDAYLPMIRARLTKPIQPVLDLGEL